MRIDIQILGVDSHWFVKASYGVSMRYENGKMQEFLSFLQNMQTDVFLVDYFMKKKYFLQ